MARLGWFAAALVLLPLGQVLAEPAQFNDKGEVLRPADYREWVFLTSGLGMTYGPNAVRPGQPAPLENVSINNGGRTQGDVVAVEASVKDTARYPDGGWAYLTFDGPQGLQSAAAPFPRTQSCYSCHSANGAVEWTFTQFYPAQFEVAKRLGTVRADYDPSKKLTE